MSVQHVTTGVRERRHDLRLRCSFVSTPSALTPCRGLRIPCDPAPLDRAVHIQTDRCRIRQTRPSPMVSAV